TAETLSSKSVKDLAQMAKRRGVNGWHAMRKDQLIRALVRLAASKPATNGHKPATNGHAKNGHTKNGHLPKSAARRSAVPRAVSAKPASKSRSPQAVRKLAEAKAKLDRYKDLAGSNQDANGSGKDRLVVMVRGPFWLHAWWQLSRSGVSRAQAALGQEWHAAR